MVIQRRRLLVGLLLVAFSVVGAGVGVTAADSEVDAWEWNTSDEGVYYEDMAPAPTEDAMYVIVSKGLYDDDGQGTLRVSKITVDGQREWTRTFETTKPATAGIGVRATPLRVEISRTDFDTDQTRRIVLSPDGDLLAESGYGAQREIAEVDAYTVENDSRLDRVGPEGTVQWSKELQSVSDTTTLADGGVLAVGETSADGRVVVRYGPDGTTRWEQSIDWVEGVVRWNQRFLLTGDRFDDATNSYLGVLDRDGTLLGELNGTDVDTLARAEDGVYVAVDGTAIKLSPNGTQLWEEPIEGRFHDGRVQDHELYVTSSANGSSTAADNTTVVTVLDTEAGATVTTRKLTHPELGSGEGFVTRTDDGGLLYTKQRFGVAKINREGTLEWHLSEDDRVFAENESQKPPSKLGRLDYRVGETVEIVEQTDYYVLLTGYQLTAINKDGTIRREYGARSQFHGDVLNIGDRPIYGIQHGVARLAENPSFGETAAPRQGGFFGIIDTIASTGGGAPYSANPAPIISGPNDEIADLGSSSTSSNLSEETSSRSFMQTLAAFFVRMFSLEGLIMIGVTVIAVLAVRVWPDNKR